GRRRRHRLPPSPATRHRLRLAGWRAAGAARPGAGPAPPRPVAGASGQPHVPLGDRHGRRGQPRLTRPVRRIRAPARHRMRGVAAVHARAVPDPAPGRALAADRTDRSQGRPPRRSVAAGPAASRTRRTGRFLTAPRAARASRGLRPQAGAGASGPAMSSAGAARGGAPDNHHRGESMNTFEKHESEVRGYCRSFPAVFASAKGAWMTDDKGKRHLDFFAGAGVLNYGHNPDRMKQALLEYIGRDGITHTLDMYSEAKEAFIRRFNEVILAPRGLSYKFQFPGPTGTNAVEAALKLARKVTG